MRFLVVLVLTVFYLSFAEEENIVSQSNEVPEEIQKVLDIETYKIKRLRINLDRKYPAVVKDDLTLSQKIYSPVNGIVERLLVKEGDKVSKGQILAYVYSPEIAKIITNIYQAKVNYETLKKLYEREKSLYENNLITYTRFYSSKIKYENAKASLKALQDSLKIYGEVKNNLLVLRSKMDGYVAKQNVVLGDSVGINKMLFKIHFHEKLWTVAFVPIEDTVFIKEGQNVKILSPIGVSTGVIDFISHSVDPETKRVAVRIISDNKNDTLKPNMFVDVKVNLGTVDGLFIPISAVVLHEDKHFTFVKEGKNRFNPVEIKIGKRINGFYEVLGGLKEGDEVVINGTIHLKAKFFGEAEE